MVAKKFTKKSLLTGKIFNIILNIFHKWNLYLLQVTLERVTATLMRDFGSTPGKDKYENHRHQNKKAFRRGPYEGYRFSDF